MKEASKQGFLLVNMLQKKQKLFYQKVMATICIKYYTRIIYKSKNQSQHSIMPLYRINFTLNWLKRYPTWQRNSFSSTTIKYKLCYKDVCNCYDQIVELRFDLLPHVPHSQDLAPCDVFENIKKWLDKKGFPPT